MRILEIGAGSTYVAKKICEKCCPRIYHIGSCIDPYDADDFANINIISEYYSGQDIGEFDVVLMFNTLEHIPDPLSTLENISKIKFKIRTSRNWTYFSERARSNIAP